MRYNLKEMIKDNKLLLLVYGIATGISTNNADIRISNIGIFISSGSVQCRKVCIKENGQIIRYDNGKPATVWNQFTIREKLSEFLLDGYAAVEYKSLYSIYEQLGGVGYESYAGCLVNNVAFIGLKKMAEKEMADQ